MKKELGESVLPPGVASHLKPLRILVAEDDRDSTLTLTMLFNTEGHEVRSASNGKMAVREAWSEFDPDVAILDINLPQLSGWEVARQIRQRRGHDRPMIIGVSGEYIRSPDRILSEVIGFDYYLLKPYDVKVLLALIAPLRLPQPDA
jgi:DNA-binding response OmpR family regulator